MNFSVLLVLQKHLITHMKRSSSENHATGAGIFLDLLHELAVHILQTMTLIDNNVSPANLLHVFAISNDNIVRGNYNRRPPVNVIGVVVFGIHLILPELGAMLGSTVVEDGGNLRNSQNQNDGRLRKTYARCEPRKFVDPVV